MTSLLLQLDVKSGVIHIAHPVFTCFVASSSEILSFEGFPKKYASPTFTVEKDTLVGTLKYSDEVAAVGTM